VIANDSTNINKTDNHLSLIIKTTTTYDVRNPGPGLEQTQTCGEVKPLIGISTHVSIFLLSFLDLRLVSDYLCGIFKLFSDNYKHETTSNSYILVSSIGI
jgi:hypothetical protein